MKVKYFTFRESEHLNPREAACNFATDQGTNVISVCEVRGSNSQLIFVTVYYWSE